MPKHCDLDQALAASDVSVVVAPLPTGIWGLAQSWGDERTILISPFVVTLSEIYVSVVAHELVHIRRGCIRSAFAADHLEQIAIRKEERLVRRETARLLMPQAVLVRFLHQGLDALALAHEFGVLPEIAIDRLELCRPELDRLMRGVS